MKFPVLFFVLVFSLSYSFSADYKDLIKKAGDKSKYPNANYIEIFDSTTVKVEESGLSRVYQHRLYKILDEQGAKMLSSLIFDYDPLSAAIEIRGAKIYRNNGEIEIISGNRFHDYPAPAHMIYWGARQKMIDYGRLEPGEAIEVSLFRKGFTYALLQYNDEDERYIPPMKGNFYDIVEFWGDFPILEKNYNVTIPASKQVVSSFYNGSPIEEHYEDSLLKFYSFTMKELMPIEKEPQMVALSDVAPKLLISTTPEWELKSKWFYSVNEDYGSFESTAEIDKKIKEILKGAKNEMDSVSLLTHWVADEIRYSGISMGEGEGFTLHKGEMTFRDRCGVCKDKAGMLITMLRAAGFESYPAMTMAGSRIDNIPADQFNHCVTVVKLSDNKYHLLDPTWVPFVRELWSSAEQQQNYLMGVPEGADLMITPVSPPENHYFKIEANSVIDSAGNISGELVVIAEGQSDAGLRRLFVRNTKENWRKNLESEFMKIHPAIDIVAIEYGDPYNYSTPLKIAVQFEIMDYAVVTEKELIFQPVSFSGLFKNYNYHLRFDTTLTERKYPFKDRCSRQTEFYETIKVPDGFSYTASLDTISGNCDAAAYKSYSTFSNGTLGIHSTVQLKKRIYASDDWPCFKEAVVSQLRLESDYVILKAE